MSFTTHSLAHSLTHSLTHPLTQVAQQGCARKNNTRKFAPWFDTLGGGGRIRVRVEVRVRVGVEGCECVGMGSGLEGVRALGWGQVGECVC